MQELWKLLGIQAKLHISHHPISSGQVERANSTVVSMLKKYVATNQKDWHIILPLVLMAARATPHQSTGVPPFSLMTGRIKSNQITFIVTSPQHKCLGE